MKAHWLQAGREQVELTLSNGRVAVEGGVLHGHYHTYKDSAQGQKRLMLAFCEQKRCVLNFEQQIPYNMQLVADSANRNCTNDQMLVFQDMDKDVTETKTHEPEYDNDGGFRCINSFVYFHPGKREANLRVGLPREGRRKVSWNGGTPTGSWSINNLPAGTELPSGIDATLPVLTVTFHYQGDETKEKTTMCARLQGAAHVFRAIGYADKEAGVRVYSDNELRILKPWHIVLVATSREVFV